MALSICSPQLGLSPESNSGGEVYDREVINRLCDRGVKVFTLLPKGRSFTPNKNLHISYAPIQSMYPPHIFSAFGLPYLIKTYQKEKFDILRVHNPYFIGPATLVFKKLFPDVPVIASWLHLENKRLWAKFDHIITISKATKNEIIETLNYPSEKITVAYPGVDDRFQPGNLPKAKTFRRAGFTIMFVGGLKARKNPQFLIKVLEKLNNPQVKLIFAGSGPLADRLKHPQAEITGYIPEKDKPNLYHQADVVVLPSIKEGFGMTLAEAGASGIPVIGNNHSSIPEIIQDGKTGFLAKTNDVSDWVNKLLQLIKSPQLCHQMGQNGQKFIRSQFTWEKNINTHLKVYENFIS